MGIVRAEQDLTDADQLGQLDEGLFIERRNPDVLAEGLDRVSGEIFGLLAPGLLETLEQVLDPAAAVLDASNPHARKPVEYAVADQGSHGVGDGAIEQGEAGLHRRVDEAELLAASSFPHPHIAVVA